MPNRHTYHWVSSYYLPFLLPFSFLILFCIHTSHIHSPHNYYLKPFVIWLNHGEALFQKLICGICVHCICLWVYIWVVCIIRERVCTVHVWYMFMRVVWYVYLCVSTCGIYICVCVCMCMCSVCECLCFCVVRCMEGCVMGMVCVCVICSVFVYLVSLCMWRGVWYMCVGLCMCSVPLCLYMYVYVCMSVSVRVVLGVHVYVPLCVWLCFYVCVFTPAWGLQPHRSRSAALLSDLSIPARIQSLPGRPHGLRSVSRESGEALPVASVYKSAQLCAWVCDMPTASAEDRCLWLPASQDLRKSLSQAPECLNSWESVFPLRPYFHSSLKEKNILGDSISHSY